MLIKFAWRNIWRQRRRTILTLSAVAFATAILVFFISLQLSSYETSVKASTAIFHGQLQIQAKTYLADPDIRKVIHGSKNIIDLVKTNNKIKNFGSRAIAFALASSNDRSIATQVVGVEIEREKNISTIAEVIREGTFLTAAGEAVIGKTLAKNLKVKPGSEITLLGQGYDGSLAAAVLKVVGVFETGSQDADRGLMLVDLENFQEIFATHSSIHTIVMRLNSIKDSDSVKADLQNKLRDYAVLDWQDLLPGLKQGIELDFAASWLFYFSLLLLVSLTVMNTFLMSIMERTKEFGVLLAVGMRPAKIVRMILLELGFVTILGIIIGTFLAILLVGYYGIYGFAIPGSAEIVKVWNLPVMLYPKVSVISLLVGPIVVIISSAFATIIPSLRIYKIQPSIAMRAI